MELQFLTFPNDEIIAAWKLATFLLFVNLGTWCVHFIYLPLWVFFPQEACGFFKTFFLKIFIYLAALGLGGGTWDLRYIMQDISLLHTGSVVVVCRISCPTACGILVPGPRIEPAPLVWQSKFLTTGPPGKSPYHSFHSVWGYSLLYL